MRAYMLDEEEGDRRLPHDSGKEIDKDQLMNIGVRVYNFPDAASLEEMAASRKYKNRDEITISPKVMGRHFEAETEKFFNEHLHEDEEIRYILEGVGYFDVRDALDKWVRIRMEQFDCIILPAGIFHRFTTDDSDYIKAMRLFKDNPKWEAKPRSDPLTAWNMHHRQYKSVRDRKARELGIIS